MRVVVEAGALRDGRATAGIGRYVRSLTAALGELDGLELHLSIPASPPRSERHPLRYLHAQPRLVATALRWRPHLVHAVTSEPVLGFPLGRQVVTVHDVVPWTSTPHSRGFAGRGYLAAQAWRLRRSGAVIAVSARVADEAIAALRLLPERVTVVSEGVDPVFQPTPAADDAERRARLGVGETPYLLWTGSMLAHDPRKALDLLVMAVAATAADHPGLTLVTAGRVGTEGERLRRTAERHGVRVVQPGFVSDADLAALHRGAAASVVPSLDEGFGLPVLEALACGAPLVATRAGNIPDLAGDAACLVAPGDARSLADGLRSVLTEGGGELRIRGPRRAAAFTWRRAAEETLAVYRHVASSPWLRVLDSNQ